MIIPKMLVTQKEFEDEKLILQKKINDIHNEYCEFINEQQRKYFEKTRKLEYEFNKRIRWTDEKWNIIR